MSAPLPMCSGVLAMVCIAAGAASGGDPPADLGLAETASPATVRIDHRVTIGYQVTNSGPGTASAVSLKIPLGDGWRVDSVASSTGGCAGVRALYCHLGDIPNGGHVTVTIVARPQAKGKLHPRGGLTSDTSDPNPNNNFSVAEVKVVDPFTGILPENATVHVHSKSFHLRYGCPASVPMYCRGNVDIDLPRSPSAPSGQPPTVLAARDLSLPSGVDGTFRVRLNGTAIHLLKKTRVIHVLAITDAYDGAGTHARQTARLTLIGPKPKKKKK